MCGECKARGQERRRNSILLLACLRVAGDLGDEFYVLRQGEASVTVRTLKGEKARWFRMLPCSNANAVRRVCVC